jgi:hypothetical protein
MHRNKIKAGWLIIGCKSWYYRYWGNLEMSSVINHFFTAGTPFVGGCLWNVGDKDIDSYIKKFLELWMEESKVIVERISQNESPKSLDIEKSILKWRNEARKVCKLKYLTGFSLTFYGVPLVLLN